MTSTRFAIFLKAQRVAAGMTQTVLAERLGVRPSSVSHWETGKGKPNPERVPRIAVVLRIGRDAVAEAMADHPTDSLGRRTHDRDDQPRADDDGGRVGAAES